MTSINPSKALSRRTFLLGSAQAGVLALAAGCAPAPLALAVQPASADLRRRSAPPLPSAVRPQLALPEPSLDVKIGQMLMVGFRGTSAPDDSVIVRAIREQHVGSVVLFDREVWGTQRNISSPDQLRALTTTLQAAASRPLLIAVDQEGGQVSRLKETYGFPRSDSAAFLGVVNDLNRTYDSARAMALALREVGINLNLAPVVDLNVNPANPVIARYERSFSADPNTVIAHASAFVQAHHSEGILCTLKHFPGHGSSRADTHTGFVDVTETWDDIELEPYRKLVTAGLADAVMTAHIYNASLDAERPATLSPAIITGLLRQQIGFDGVVISDDMQMGAISAHYRFDQAVVEAVLAGVDIIAVANNLRYADGLAARVVAALQQAVADGVISEERIDHSYRRITRLKERIAAA